MNICKDFHLVYLDGKNINEIAKEVSAGSFCQNMNLPALDWQVAYQKLSDQQPFTDVEEASFFANYIIGCSLTTYAEKTVNTGQFTPPGITLVHTQKGMSTLSQSSQDAPRVILFDRDTPKNSVAMSLASWVPKSLMGKNRRLVLTDDLTMPPAFLSWSPASHSKQDPKMKVLFGVDTPDVNLKAIKNAQSIETATKPLRQLLSNISPKDTGLNR